MHTIMTNPQTHEQQELLSTIAKIDSSRLAMELAHQMEKGRRIERLREKNVSSSINGDLQFWKW